MINIEVIRYVAKSILYQRWFDLEKKENTPPIIKTNISLKRALDEAIGLGGGHSLHPHMSGFWFVQYKPGLKIYLWKTVQGKVITIKVDSDLFFKVCVDIWQAEHFKQLTLF